MARPIRNPEFFHVICHQCEGVLRVEVTDADLVAARAAERGQPAAV
ncbi:MAG: hypothetical protein ACR2GX_06365 [Candidatus Dormibacteria bacterium]